MRKLRRPLTADRLSRRLGVADDLRRLRAHITQLVTPAKYFRPLTVFASYRAANRGLAPTGVMRSTVAAGAVP